MADPLSVTTGIISLITLAVKLVVGAAGLIDKTTTAHREAANELQDLQRDLGRLEKQMDRIHSQLQFMVSNTKDRALKKLLQE
jgi:peptidoglycan hydrolase CwlO-like protein